MSSEAQVRASMKYDAKNTKQILLKLNKKTDSDIIKFLETVENKQGLIKSLLRFYIKSQTNENEE